MSLECPDSSRKPSHTTHTEQFDVFVSSELSSSKTSPTPKSEHSSWERKGRKRRKDLPFGRHGVSVAAVPPLHFPQNPKAQHAQHEPCGSANPSVATGTGLGAQGCGICSAGDMAGRNHCCWARAPPGPICFSVHSKREL